ncbi:hypothetical protein EJC51_47295 [Streptomyces aquilus]|uniref:DUF6292 domain-containing protein n=1 Tax=Streptomyces aquilus TaxID=2548456 RepID=A0A3S5HMD1_9ACTN|nr:DUF6292 family protein [Streptomyces aquilus]AZP14740.1 hypothetical protein EJC51_00250 [Streptomyces aquilus]AZP22964.1 hypothetical protein EJC51_47295 [Streptomyces aquilus]
MLLEPPGWPGRPEGLPHWPYVRAVDDALAARGIPPGSVHADCTTREYGGLTTYMWLTWDASRTRYRSSGIRLHWQERRGWFYALTCLNTREILLYAPLAPLRTVVPDPEHVTDVAEQLVRFRQIPDMEYRTEWERGEELRAAARDFRRAVLGLPPLAHPETPTGPGGRPDAEQEQGMRLTIDTLTDTYEQALAAVQAIYGHNEDAPHRRSPTDLGQALRPTMEEHER